jgi:hypothetical protein
MNPLWLATLLLAAFIGLFGLSVELCWMSRFQKSESQAMPAKPKCARARTSRSSLSEAPICATNDN